MLKDTYIFLNIVIKGIDIACISLI